MSMSIPSEFALLRGLVGLTAIDAAEFFQVDVDTVDSWESSNPAPSSVIENLKTLWEKILDIADKSLNAIDELTENLGRVEKIEWGLPTSNLEAQEVLGLPSIGCAQRIGALVSIECEHPINFVQRGSTTASRQAIKARLSTEAHQQPYLKKPPTSF